MRDLICVGGTHIVFRERRILTLQKLWGVIFLEVAHRSVGGTGQHWAMSTTLVYCFCLRGCGISPSLAAMPFLAQSLLRNVAYGSSVARHTSVGSCSVADSPLPEAAKAKLFASSE